jgi:predicted nucleic acid-binding protein
VRAPSPTLVLDANVLIAAARGRSSGAILLAAQAAALVTTDRAIEEARRRILLGMKQPELLPNLNLLLQNVSVAPVAMLSAMLPQAEAALRDAMPSRNGSIRDAHVLALAWSVDGDVWTTDRDFAGTGVASWSTANLMRALAEAGRAELASPIETDHD